MNLTQLFAVWRGRWLTVVGCTVALMAIAYLVCLAMPNKYEAVSALLVDTVGGDALANRPSGANSQTVMATQSDLVTSERVARRVVATLGLVDQPRWKARWMDALDGAGDPAAGIATLLLKRLDVKPNKDSTVINISYKDSGDPKRTADIANAFAQATVDTMLELKVAPARQYAGWFVERTKGLRSDLDAAQAKLGAFQRAHGLINTSGGGQIDIETAKLSQLTQQLLEVQSTRTETNARQVQATGNAQTSPDVLNSPLNSALRADIARGEANLRQLQASLGDRNPQVLALQEQVSTLKAELEGEMRKVTRSLKANDEVGQRREGELRAAVAAQRDRVLELTRSSNELTVLQRDVSNAQQALDLVASKQAESSLQSQIQQTNVLLLTPAAEPATISSPKYFLATASAAALGLIVGLGLALLLEMRAPILRSADDLAIALDLPVIAVVSTFKRVSAGPRWLALGSSTPKAA